MTKRLSLLLLLLLSLSRFVSAQTASSPNEDASAPSSDDSPSSDVLLWYEDFSGYNQKDCSSGMNFIDTKGFNATYNTEVKTGSVTLDFFSPNEHQTKSPMMTLKGSAKFIVSIPLHGASGDLQLSFSSTNSKEVVVSSSSTSISATGNTRTVNVAPGTDNLQLTFSFKSSSRNSKSVSIDDIKLTAPSSCWTEKAADGISFPQEEYSFVLGNLFTSPAPNNTNSLDVQYWSSDKSVAIVSDQGQLKLNGLGSATIYAVCPGNDAYGYSVNSYALNVTRDKPSDEVFYESFDKNTGLGGNDNSFEESTSAGTAEYDNNGVSSSNASFAYPAYKCIELKSKVVLNIGAIPALGNGNGGYLSFKAAGVNKSNLKVTLGITNGKLESNSITVNQGEWTNVKVPFSEANSETTFSISGSSVYLDSISIISFPKSVSLNVGDYGYATMYYENYGLVVPEGVEAYTAKIEGNNIVPSRRYSDGDMIPKATAVIIKAQPGNYSFNVNADESALAGDNVNLLKGTEVSSPTTGGSKYYKLTYDSNGIGFYWGADNGEAFNNGAHKAYIALDATAAKRSYAFNIDDVTGISAAQTSYPVADGKSYNVMGQRIDGNSFHGIMIRNGKKYIKR